MSADLGDTAAYGAFLASSDAQPARPPGGEPVRRSGTATEEEWRTPPLWGLRDSAPYLHDGRAGTIEEAIRLHGGEASASAQRFEKLPARDQAELQFFLLSLAAPNLEAPPADR
jgi:cytochrome c peroxidase